MQLKHLAQCLPNLSSSLDLIGNIIMLSCIASKWWMLWDMQIKCVHAQGKKGHFQLEDRKMNKLKEDREEFP